MERGRRPPLSRLCLFPWDFCRLCLCFSPDPFCWEQIPHAQDLASANVNLDFTATLTVYRTAFRLV